MNENDFSAVTVDVNATEFVSQSKQTLLMALAVILGGFVGVIYVLIASSIRGKTKNSIAWLILKYSYVDDEPSLIDIRDRYFIN